MAPPFRADQVGSLIRPASLLEARKGLGMYSDEATDDQLTATSAAIGDAVKKQLDLDVRPLTSGEYERADFFSGFFEKLEGMQPRHDLRIPEDFRTGLPTTQYMAKLGLKTFPAVVATGKIKHVASAYLPGWEMLKKVVPQEHWKDCKVTMPSLTWQHMHMVDGVVFTPESYTSSREYLADLVAACRKEIQILYDAGLRILQIDAPNLTFFVLDAFKEGLNHDGHDPDELLDLYIWAHNQLLKDLPADLRVGIHLCRGNMPDSRGFLEGSYDAIARQVFEELDYETFYLEFDDERSGSFECLKHVPKGKNVVLGLVSTKVAELEACEVLERRVREAAAHMAQGQGVTEQEALQSLAISPQCGFAGFNYHRGVGTEERQWEKLTLLRDTARNIWSDAV